MDEADRFDRYLDDLSKGLGHADRHAGLRGYCTGLILPLSRKSVEPWPRGSIDARQRPSSGAAPFFGQGERFHEEMLRRVCQWVIPKMDFAGGGWIIDDTGFPKKGRQSSALPASNAACWASKTTARWPSAPRQGRCAPGGALCDQDADGAAQLRASLAQGPPDHCVLARCGLRVDNAFRQARSDLGLLYAVGVTSAVVVWPPGVKPLLPKLYSGMGRPPVMPRRTPALQADGDAVRQQYVTTNKNDAADPEAICEAVGRPDMRFVSIKNVEQRAVLSLHRVRQGFVKARDQT